MVLTSLYTCQCDADGRRAKCLSVSRAAAERHFLNASKEHVSKPLLSLLKRGDAIIPVAPFVAEICGCPWLRLVAGPEALSIDVDVSTVNPPW